MKDLILVYKESVRPLGTYLVCQYEEATGQLVEVWGFRHEMARTCKDPKDRE